MFDTFTRFVADDVGSTSIEYALLAALMAIASIGAARALSQNVSQTWSTIEAGLSNAN